MYFEIDGHSALKAALKEMCAELAEENVPAGKVFDSKLALNELVINALRYGGGRAYVSAERRRGEIRITVRSEIAYRPPEESFCPDTRAERGRGMYLVDALCSTRVYNETEGICVVLCIENEM